MIPRLKPTIGVRELVAAFQLPRRDDVERFEQSFAELMGQKYALAFPYGRTGLMLLLEALGLKDKEIICPAYTCVVVPHAITYSGNKPVFIDCEEGGFNMDLNIAEHAINEKTGAIIATSLFGYPVNMDRLDEIRKRHPNIFIIQDCAHSFAATWNGKPVQKEGIAALFGLNISKILTSIFGGMITTDNEDVYRKLKTMREQRLKKPGWGKGLRRLLYLLAVYPAFWEPVYGLINRLERLGVLNYFVKYYDDAKIDMPSDYKVKMSPIEARVGMIQINKYENIIRARRKYASYYKLNLQNDILIKSANKVEASTHSQIVALIDQREFVLKEALKMGVQFGIVLEYCVPNMKVYNKIDKSNIYANATYYAEHIINLPVCGKFKEKDARKVVHTLKTFLPKII